MKDNIVFKKILLAISLIFVFSIYCNAEPPNNLPE
jgi:hypothetical protein